ncbi:MAG TPA: LLM class F420-dependent oxidoreductase [Anaerolineales bacterium]|nr:LLM class F420-dependent oxidoreductase [Anaerolineales bacterium]
MKVGVIYPQYEYGNDPAAIRDYAQLAEALRFTHLEAYDHVLGANPERPGGWKGRYTYETPFQEVFVLFAFLSGLTQTLGFMSGILILPQRQTALVAKQAATLDVLSKGRFRLGVGLGWNEVEYIALGQDFHTRGRRIEEQIQLLRRLWTEPLVEFSGRWDRVEDAGLNPMPTRRPIPVYFGARAEPAVRRAGRIGDGWIMNFNEPEQAQAALEALDRGLAESGRTREDFTVEARLPYGEGDPAVWEKLIRGWQASGVSEFAFNPLGSGLKTPADHQAAIRKFAEAMGLSGR